jgi:3-deoxy-D-manno-octulosonic-acid transferase
MATNFTASRKQAVARVERIVYSQFPVHIFYSFFLGLALFLFFPVYFIKLRILKGERLGLPQRLALSLPKPVKATRSLWLHAVSVGEVLSLQKLVKELKDRYPGWAVYFSVLTNAGMRIAREKMKLCDRIFYVPFDFGWTVRRYFRALKPDLLVLAESELWPNLLRHGRRRTRGVLVINGRISDRSFRRYQRLTFLTGRLLGAVARFLVQTEQDQERLIRAGADRARVEVAGNLKCEITPPAFDARSLDEFRRELSTPAGKILVAGSTRPGEEEQLLRAFTQARREKADVFLVIAPRHIERIPEVEKACRAGGLSVRKRTEVRQEDAWDILLLDTVGELARVYALGDAAFIGGSLVPWGGHNLLEPAAYGKPIFFGTHMNNFSYLAQKFLHNGAARRISGAEELKGMFLFRDAAGLEKMGRLARQTLDSLQGATARTVQVIESMMAG